ncbi:MAG: HAD-IA family hydrolase [Planctomycetota bacterium]|nr:HAD-IA family hydrolase [Planctomycetota bacterium]
MSSIQGVIFDMDGVLCDSERFICEAACRMFKERHNLTVKPEDFVPFVGAGENRYLGGVAEKYRIKWDVNLDKSRTYEIYLQIIKGRLPPLPGAVEFIRRCRARGLKLAVASSADRVKVDGNLAEIGVPAATFDACVTGNDVQKKKPDPEIFLLAAKRIGLAAETCVVVEDAPNGIRAAKAAGARCLGLTTSFDEKTLKDVGANWTAPDLASVPGELAV